MARDKKVINIIRIHHLRTIHVCTKFGDDDPNHFLCISVWKWWMKQLTNYQNHRVLLWSSQTEWGKLRHGRGHLFVSPALVPWCLERKKQKHNTCVSFHPFVNRGCLSSFTQALHPALLSLQSALHCLTSRWRHHRGERVIERKLKSTGGLAIQWWIESEGGMQRWSGDAAKYREMKGGIGEILHVEIKAVKVGPCEGGSESALPAWPNKQSRAPSMLQYTPALIIHDVCVCVCAQTYMCEFAWLLAWNVTVDEKHVNNKWYCVHGPRGRGVKRKA